MGTSDLTDHPLSRTVGMDDLARQLTRLLRKGLPATDRTAGDVLPHLRNVIARALHPDDVISRIESLNQLLTRLLRDLEHERYGQPARILFAVAAGMSGTTQTARREAAARYLEYDLDHLRKRVEPAIVRVVAEALYRDMLRYKKRVTGGDNFADYRSWELSEDDITVEEELASIVWKFVYAVRAELIAARRQGGVEGFETRVDEHYRLAATYSTALDRAIDNYRHLFGPIIRHAGVEFNVEGLRSHAPSETIHHE